MAESESVNIVYVLSVIRLLIFFNTITRTFCIIFFNEYQVVYKKNCMTYGCKSFQNEQNLCNTMQMIKTLSFITLACNIERVK